MEADVILKRGRKITEIKTAYKDVLPISGQKYKDLIKMCNDLTIPKAYHDFYKKLKFSSNTRDCLPQPDQDEDSEYEV